MLHSLAASLRRQRGFVGAALLIIAASVAWDRVAWPSFDRFLSTSDFSVTPFLDFTGNYYVTAQRLFTTAIPQRAYFYPPLLALLLSPLTALPADTALAIWVVAQLVATGVLIAVPAGVFLRRSRAAALAYVALVCLSYPVMHSFLWGQVSTIITAALFTSAALYQRHARFRAAALLALSVCVKLYPGIVGVYYLLRRDWRYVLSVGALVAAGLTLPALAIGPVATIRFYETVSQQLVRHLPMMRASVGSENLANLLMRVSFCPDITLAPYCDTPGHEAWRFVFRAAAAGVAIAAIWLLYRLRARWQESMEWVQPVALLLLLLPLVVETCWPHYLVFLPLGQIVAWTGATGSRRAVLIQRGLAVVSMVQSTTPLFRLMNNSARYLGFGLLTSADLLLLAVLAWQFTIDARSPRAGEDA